LNLYYSNTNSFVQLEIVPKAQTAIFLLTKFCLLKFLQIILNNYNFLIKIIVIIKLKILRQAGIGA